MRGRSSNLNVDDLTKCKSYHALPLKTRQWLPLTSRRECKPLAQLCRAHVRGLAGPLSPTSCPPSTLTGSPETSGQAPSHFDDGVPPCTFSACPAGRRIPGSFWSFGSQVKCGCLGSAPPIIPLPRPLIAISGSALITL